MQTVFSPGTHSFPSYTVKQSLKSGNEVSKKGKENSGYSCFHNYVNVTSTYHTKHIVYIISYNSSL